MVVITVAAKVNDSHSAANVATKLVAICNDRFDIDLQAVASGGGSDTANAAQAVQNVLGIEQNDCTMHIVSLLLSYSIGMRDNYKTEKTVDKMGKEMKIQYIVTPGGAFPLVLRLSRPSEILLTTLAVPCNIRMILKQSKRVQCFHCKI